MHRYQALWPRGKLTSQTLQADDRIDPGQFKTSECLTPDIDGKQEHLVAPAGRGIGTGNEPVDRDHIDHASVLGPEDLRKYSQGALGQRISVERFTLTSRAGNLRLAVVRLDVP